MYICINDYINHKGSLVMNDYTPFIPSDHGMFRASQGGADVCKCSSNFQGSVADGHYRASKTGNYGCWEASGWIMSALLIVFLGKTSFQKRTHVSIDLDSLVIEVMHKCRRQQWTWWKVSCMVPPLIDARAQFLCQSSSLPQQIIGTSSGLWSRLRQKFPCCIQKTTYLTI